MTKRDELIKKIVYLLKGNYTCGRSWEAWQYGTMSQEDFAPLEECTQIIDDFMSLIDEQKELAVIEDKERIKGEIESYLDIAFQSLHGRLKFLMDDQGANNDLKVEVATDVLNLFKGILSSFSNQSK